mgnify:CR=1 FL=1
MQLFERLALIRDRMGWIYGSEDLCVLLYSLVKRMQPGIVIELGSGFGVTTAWIAAAMKESGRGVLHTYDNGSHFESGAGQRVLQELEAPLRAFAAAGDERPDYLVYLAPMLRWVDVMDHVVAHQCDIDFKSVASSAAFNAGVDIVFSDFNHSPVSIQSLLSAFLPRLADCASIFIDSASTHRLSYLTLEKIVADLNSNKLPLGILAGLSVTEEAALICKVQRSRFRLMHLIEAHVRAQNSTAWISIEPVDTVATAANHFH